MKKVITICLSVIALVAILMQTLYVVDHNRMKNGKPVIFSTWGARIQKVDE